MNSRLKKIIDRGGYKLYDFIDAYNQQITTLSKTITISNGHGHYYIVVKGNERHNIKKDFMQ